MTQKQLETTIENKGLLPYRSAKGTLITLASLLIPVGSVAVLLMYALANPNTHALNALVPISDTQRIALLVHGLYFLGLPIFFELGLKYMPLPGLPKSFALGHVPDKPDNLYWMTTILSGELFFIMSLVLLIMATQEAVPVWALLIPLAQCAYNIKNDLIWYGFGERLSPVGQKMKFMLIDWILIGIITTVYLTHFFSIAK